MRTSPKRAAVVAARKRRRAGLLVPLGALVLLAPTGIAGATVDPHEPVVTVIASKDSQDRSKVGLAGAIDQGVASCFGIRATIVGTEGDDVLEGTDGPDVIMGLGGDDRIYGLAGDDVICAGDGDDRVYGGGGDNEIYGGSGIDKLRAGNGDDRVFGGYGVDFIKGGGGDDVLLGQQGADRIRGYGGADVLSGGEGRDLLWGGPGDDSLNGGPGADSIKGSAGRDQCIGGSTTRFVHPSCETAAPLPLTAISSRQPGFVEALDFVLGPPVQDTGWTNGAFCAGRERVVEWDGFLAVYAEDGGQTRLVSYVLSGNRPDALASPITIGEPMAEAKARFGDMLGALISSTEFGLYAQLDLGTADPITVYFNDDPDNTVARVQGGTECR